MQNLPTNNSLTSMASNYWNHVTSVFISFTKYVDVKAIGTALLAVYQFCFDVHQEQAMPILACLVLFDTITGVYAAKIVGERIESKKVVKAAFKLGIYALLVSASFMTDKLMGLSGVLELDKLMVGFLAATELISIIENAGKMGYAVPKKILNFLTDFTNKESISKK